MLIHFKAEVCPSMDIPKIVADLFPGGVHLVVRHKGKHQNAHWHFQGQTELTCKEVDKYLADLIGKHSKKLMDSKTRPIKRAKKDIDENGYQYMMKEGVESVVSAGVTMTETILAELWEKSKEHVDELKHKCLNWIRDKMDWTKRERREGDGSPDHAKEWHARVAALTLDYYSDVAETMMPPNVRALVVYNYLKLAKEALTAADVSKVKAYISRKVLM